MDTPPMWKKIWDLWYKRYNNTMILLQRENDNIEKDENDEYIPYPAQYAIENMIRIATTKGNTKRVAELKLKLVQCLKDES